MYLLQPYSIPATTIIFLTFLTDLAEAFGRKCCGGSVNVNHAVLWPSLIGGLVASCLLCYCCVVLDEKLCGHVEGGGCCFGDRDVERGQSSVPRSEYLAMQRRMNRLEQEVNTLRRTEEV